MWDTLSEVPGLTWNNDFYTIKSSQQLLINENNTIIFKRAEEKVKNCLNEAMVEKENK